MFIAENLKKIRKKCALTQNDIADSLGISRSTYTYWELGKSRPSYEDLIKLTKVFNIDVKEIIFGDSPDEQTKRVVRPTHGFSEPSDDVLAYLKKDEQLLLIAFRLLSEENKPEALSVLRDFVDKKNEEDK